MDDNAYQASKDSPDRNFDSYGQAFSNDRDELPEYDGPGPIVQMLRRRLLFKLGCLVLLGLFMLMAGVLSQFITVSK